MRRCLLFPTVTLLLIVATTVCVAQVSITGLNEAEYIYKAAEDSLSNYFHNETTIRMSYNNLEFGFSFIAEYPEYDQFEAIDELHPNDIAYRWDERYLQLNLTQMRLRAGSFNEFFGSGLVLRSYRDRTYQHDSRLTGLNLRANIDKVSLKALYGVLPNENNETRKDIVSGLDLESSLIQQVRLGGSFTAQQIRRFDDKYSTRLVAGLRGELTLGFADLYAEYAESKSYRTIGGETKGDALYLMANAYLSSFSFSAGYKNYWRFDERLNDLPILNSSEEPLSERYDTGYDEEGLFGQLRYNPDFRTSVDLAYSEAWNRDFSLRQSDLFVQGKRDLDTIVLYLEYSQLEFVDYEWNAWERDITPALAVDWDLLELPIYTRMEYGYRKYVRNNVTNRKYNPLFQTDLFFKHFSLSLISEIEFDAISNVSDSELWLGAELSTTISRHTDLKLFVGEEKGGKVCRSGVCFYTTPFKGLKLDLTTRF